MRTKVVSLFIFFQELLNKKKMKALRPEMTKKASRGSCLKGKTLDASIVIFGRSSLIFVFCSKGLAKINMKNDSTFVRMRNCDLHRDAKMLKKGTSLRQI